MGSFSLAIRLERPAQLVPAGAEHDAPGHRRSARKAAPFEHDAASDKILSDTHRQLGGFGRGGLRRDGPQGDTEPAVSQKAGRHGARGLRRLFSDLLRNDLHDLGEAMKLARQPFPRRLTSGRPRRVGRARFHRPNVRVRLHAQAQAVLGHRQRLAQPL